MEGDKKNKQKRQPCEVYSRVVGYIRPVGQWNAGKQSEYSDRKTIKISQTV
ncbi:MAG TPA: anaerobic ribonucleoside-triphosphate reductase [Patescibacteria group bacterium]|nr:anaerobic ribonucleoside-triphosphate reductase [Patescibacteria group bacterium]